MVGTLVRWCSLEESETSIGVPSLTNSMMWRRFCAAGGGTGGRQRRQERVLAVPVGVEPLLHHPHRHAGSWSCRALPTGEGRQLSFLCSLPVICLAIMKCIFELTLC